jgi:hypothetical protein
MIDLFVALELGGLTLLLAADLYLGRLSIEYYFRMISSPGDIVSFLGSHTVVGGWFCVSVFTSALPTLVHMLLTGTAILTKLFRRPLYLLLEPPVYWFAVKGWLAVTLITFLIGTAVRGAGELIEMGIIPGDRKITIVIQGLWSFLARHPTLFIVILLFLIVVASTQEFLEGIRRHKFKVFETLRQELDLETVRQHYIVSKDVSVFLIGVVLKEMVCRSRTSEIDVARISLDIEGEATLIDARLVKVFPHSLAAEVMIAESGRKININIGPSGREREASFGLLAIGRYDGLGAKAIQSVSEVRLVRLPKHDFFSPEMGFIDKASLFFEFIFSGIITAGVALAFFLQRPMIYDWITLMLITIVELTVLRIRPFFQYIYAFTSKIFDRSALPSFPFPQHPNNQ